MVLPIGDDNSEVRSTPWVNYLIIALNVLVFVFLQDMGNNTKFTYEFATVPKEIITGHDLVTHSHVVEDRETGEQYQVPGLQPTPGSVYLTLFVSMFMHGGIAHIAGNMWFLFIFGDNVEDDFGHVRYLIFYLLSGILASLAHVAMNASGPGAEIPSLGASGAISGVMGAYLLLHPRNPVRVILIRVFTIVPAFVAVGIWFVFQIVSGMGLLGGGQQDDGVAYAAHVGGFLAGMILAKPFTFGARFKNRRFIGIRCASPRLNRKRHDRTCRQLRAVHLMIT